MRKYLLLSIYKKTFIPASIFVRSPYSFSTSSGSRMTKSIPFPLESLSKNWTQRRLPSGDSFAQFDGKVIEKSPNDKRLYRLIKLGNGLEAMLISDITTDKAACSLSVGVGHLNDPDELPGLAHFCEHMLFLGTEKYPSEAEYKTYLSQNSGSSNASTSLDETNYYLDCSTTALPGALSRHSQFFISPLFDPSSTLRELNAVDSEFRKNLQLDERRLFQLGKATSNRDVGSKYWKFGTGSKDTLGVENIREKLIEWYKVQYSANLMKLVVLSSKSLDELQDLVVNEYSGIPNHNLEVPFFPVHPIGESQRQLQIHYRTIKNIPKLRIEFPFADQRSLWATRPGRFIGHFVGHEGPGSILAELKSRGWALGLSAGAGGGVAGFEFFRITASLTQAGLENYQEVVQIIFLYLKLLQSTPPQELAFREMESLSSIAWKFKEVGQPSSTVKSLSSTLHSLYPREKILSGAYSANVFDKELLKEGIESLTSNNCRIFVGSQEPQVSRTGEKWDQTEEYYGTEYFIENFRGDHWPQELPRIEPKLALPKPNPFIPERLEILPPSPENQYPSHRPTLIRETANSRLFYKKDDTWNVPRATAFFLLKTPIADESAQAAMRSQMFTALVEESLSEITYDSSLAGINFSVGTDTEGLQIVVSGYNDKLLTLLKVVLEKVKEEEIDLNKFEMIHERLCRAYSNAQLSNPSSLADTHVRHLTKQTHWTYEARLKALEGMTPQDIKEHQKALLSSLKIESLIHGNVSMEEALVIMKTVEEDFKSITPPGENDYHRALILPSGSNLVYRPLVPSPENVNSAATIFYQVGPSSDTKVLAQLHLFSQIAKTPIFSTLRTKEQLGYIVQSGLSIQNGFTGFKVIVQSERTGGYLESRIEILWKGFEKYLKEMEEKDFEREKSSLILKRLEKVKNLGQETMRYWDEIDLGRLDFKYREKSAEAISLVTKDQLIDFFQTYISPDSPTRTKLSILLRSQRLQAEVLTPLSIEFKTILSEPLLTKSIELLSSKPTIQQIKDFVNKIDNLPVSIKNILVELEKKPDDLPLNMKEIEDIEKFKLGLERADPIVPIEDYKSDILAHL